MGRQYQRPGFCTTPLAKLVPKEFSSRHQDATVKQLCHTAMRHGGLHVSGYGYFPLQYLHRFWEDVSTRETFWASCYYDLGVGGVKNEEMQLQSEYMEASKVFWSCNTTQPRFRKQTWKPVFLSRED